MENILNNVFKWLCAYCISLCFESSTFTLQKWQNLVAEGSMSNSNGGPRTCAKQGSFGGLVNIKSTAIPNTHFNLQVQITFDVYCFYAKQTAVDQLNCFPDRMQSFIYWSLPIWAFPWRLFRNANNIDEMVITLNERKLCYKWIPDLVYDPMIPFHTFNDVHSTKDLDKIVTYN